MMIDVVGHVRLSTLSYIYALSSASKNPASVYLARQNRSL